MVQGGSTITQQLVKNTLGLDPWIAAFQRKFQELALAIRAEQRYTKDEILALYLNDVYFANGIYGIGTAADFYFHVPASRAEAARERDARRHDPLAVLLRPAGAPVNADPPQRRAQPDDRPGRRGRPHRDQALPGRTRSSNRWSCPRAPAKASRSGNQPFFVRYIISQILNNANGEFDVFGKSENARQRRLYEGGLKIITTLDPEVAGYAQQAANQPYAVVHAEPRAAPTRTRPSCPSTTRRRDPHDALGQELPEDKLDLADPQHQPGSSFKPFILVAAFRKGCRRRSLLEPLTVLQPDVERQRPLVRQRRRRGVGG